MNKTRDRSDIKILTDIQIIQSPRWCEMTDYLGHLYPSDELINKLLPIKAGKTVQPFLELVKLLKYRNRYDVVINGGIRRSGQLFALFRRILHIKTPKQIMLEVMLDEEKRTIFWKLKKIIQRIIFLSVDIIFVSSTNEVESYSARFGVSKEKFRFLPFHTNIAEPRLVNGPGNYILSAGKAGRDYATLAGAIRELNRKIIVVSDKESTKDVGFPDGVAVLYDIPYRSYLSLLYDCCFVVVPLKKFVKSTGQVVILEAMALGKPVIATETTGTIDYIQSGVNGILVPVGDSEALKNAIKRVVNDNNLYKELAVNALECVKKNHTFDIYVSRVLQAADELIKRPQFTQDTGLNSKPITSD